MMLRGSGILLHITSLPSPFGIGDMGPCAYRFADFLQEARQSFWQILPLNPTDLRYDHSPYHSVSAFAFNPNLISLELLADEGWVDGADLEAARRKPEDLVDWEQALAPRHAILRKATDRFKNDTRKQGEFERFCSDNAVWLDDYALYMALRETFQGRAWSEWPQEVRDRKSHALDPLRTSLAGTMENEKIVQFLAAGQWFALKNYCNERGIRIIGDIPIYPEFESAELWSFPELFKLDPDKRPYAVAGVPPDYFSATGQLWGNPLYDWEAHKREGYRWWMRRVGHNLSLFDVVRIDHFRGLVAYWEVPASHDTAMHGRWIDAPALDFLSRLCRRYTHLPIIAEDLGLITPDVREVMSRFNLPGMKPLIFAFGEDMAVNPYSPHNLDAHCIAYTGTHDNNTVKGWFENEASDQDRRRVFEYLGRIIPIDELAWEMVRTVMMSVADVAILPMQDLLGLGQEARMNCPSLYQGNWRWRASEEAFHPVLGQRLRKLTELYGRA